MKQTIQSITVAAILLATIAISCKKNKTQASNNTTDANTVKGIVYHAKGNKYAIDNSSVLVHVLGPNGAPAYHIGMDNNSQYEQKVTQGLYTFEARAWATMNGKVISVVLDPADGKPASTQFNSAGGINRDFRLKLTGLVPGGDPAYAYSYYGAKVAVCDGAYFLGANGTTNNLSTKYPGSTAIFILTPKGPCIDGSTPPIAEIHVAVDNLKSSTEYLVNFPLARYYLSALLKKANGQQIPLRLNFTNAATGNRYDFLDLSFSPVASDPNCNPGTPRAAIWEN